MGFIGSTSSSVDRKPIRSVHSALIAVLAAAVILPARMARGATVTTNPYRGVTVIDRTETTPVVRRAEHLHIVEIVLTDPDIHFKLSPALPLNGKETSTQTTLNFMNQEKAQLAVNVHFFDFINQQTTYGTNLTGFASSLGNVFSAFDAAPVLNYALLPNSPVLNIDANNNAQFALRGATDTSLVLESDPGTPLNPYNAVSGSAQIITNGAISIPQGLPPRPNVTPTSFWYTDQIAGRTAIGLSQDAKTLFLFTVDAAGGMQVDEEAQFLLSQYGIYNAINLDGGGSTTLTMADPTSGIGSVINGISGNTRLVGTSLAIFAAPAAAVPEPGSIVLLAGSMTTLLIRRRGRK